MAKQGTSRLGPGEIAIRGGSGNGNAGLISKATHACGELVGSPGVNLDQPTSVVITDIHSPDPPELDDILNWQRANNGVRRPSLFPPIPNET